MVEGIKLTITLNVNPPFTDYREFPRQTLTSVFEQFGLKCKNCIIYGIGTPKYFMLKLFWKSGQVTTLTHNDIVLYTKKLHYLRLYDFGIFSLVKIIVKKLCEKEIVRRYIPEQTLYDIDKEQYLKLRALFDSDIKQEWKGKHTLMRNRVCIPKEWFNYYTLLE